MGGMVLEANKADIVAAIDGQQKLEREQGSVVEKLAAMRASFGSGSSSRTSM